MTAKTMASTFWQRLGGERGAHWLTTDRLNFYSVGALICYLCFYAIYIARTMLEPPGHMSPLAIDFVPFWSAAHLALAGHAVDAYNFAVLEQVERAALSHDPGVLPWLYPPSFLLFVSPFALLPWKISAALFLGGTYATFVKAMHLIVGRKEVWIVAVAFPGAALAVLTGQNGLLTASLVAFGLVLLPRRPVLAGICFGVLCMKPQLAVLVPFALLCARSWRALGALVVTALAMLALSVGLFGVDTLHAFLHNMGTAAGYVESGRAALHRVPSAYSLVKLAHGPTMLANAAQAVSALSAIAAVWYAWSRDASQSLRAATLVCASLMVSPYFYDYDLAWLGVLVAWYAKYGMERGWRPLEREWLIVLWLTPIFGISLVKILHIQFIPLILAATLFVLIRSIAAQRHAARAGRGARWANMREEGPAGAHG